MVSSHDVARMAGVSQSTVSRVLSNSNLVRAATRDRVLKAAEQVGYQPNAMARAMRTRRTNSIGIVVSRINNPFYPQIVQLIGKALAEIDLKMTLWDSEGAGERGAVEAAKAGSIDGLIFTTATSDSKPLKAAISSKIPLVLVNRVVESLDCDQVSSANYQSGRMVAHHLLSLGHRAMALLGGPLDASTSREREAGFTDDLKQAGFPLRPDFFQRGPFSYDTGFDSVARLVKNNPKQVLPTAVFCVNDLIAFGALDAAKAHHLQIPAQFSVVGHDDIEMAEWRAFDLTTVRQPLLEIVDTALSLLRMRIKNPSRPTEAHRFSSQLILRQSSGEMQEVDVT